MNSIFKKLIILFNSISICFLAVVIPVYADSNDVNVNEQFVSLIEKEYNISTIDENVEIQINQNGTTSIVVLESEKQVTIYTSPTLEESKLLNNYNANKRGVVWTAIVWLFKAYSVGSTIKTGCQVIQGVSGVDVCGLVSRQANESLVAAGTKKRFKIIRTVEKKACPFPPSSQQCNEAPFAYWKTTIQGY